MKKARTRTHLHGSSSEMQDVPQSPFDKKGKRDPHEHTCRAQSETNLDTLNIRGEAHADDAIAIQPFIRNHFDFFQPIALVCAGALHEKLQCLALGVLHCLDYLHAPNVRRVMHLTCRVPPRCSCACFLRSGHSQTLFSSPLLVHSSNYSTLRLLKLLLLSPPTECVHLLVQTIVMWTNHAGGIIA